MEPSTSPLNSLLARLSAGTASSAELERAAGKSQSWVNATLRDLIAKRRVVRLGSRRGARYALRREIQPIGSAWPLYRIGRNGEPVELGVLHALAGGGFFFDAGKAATAGGINVVALSEGLPYLLQDQRPGGFLGRAVPRQYPQLNAPPRVQDWTDDHYLRYLTNYGSDGVGDLILGRPALDDYLRQQRLLVPRDPGSRHELFPALADQSMRDGVPGSSAQGENPKFAVALGGQDDVRHMLVKFSPPVESAVGRRWSDLLIAEHRALEALAAADVLSARSRIFQFADRTFLEVDRFDRVGVSGRIGVTSLFAIDLGCYGKLDDWISAAQRLHAEERIDLQTLDDIRLVSSFADLIANTDKHFGNLAFFDAYDGRYRLAPVYDMLPMLFAPVHDQLVARSFTPANPTGDTLRVWGRARALAEEYWRSLASETRISDDFRTISKACLQTLESLPKTGAYAPRTAPPPP